ncbi:MAG: universal stress protein [Rhodobacter sp.]|uniref:universal stress protein n=1 Tax=Pararhodobacter sp. TaxID=2127056 RepID=UPI001D85865C|nr:universal stress protein [Pararhodobacter sp.]MCB1343872.1 universal stress protein [Paracoccaceae bacterium]MCC0073317.1 universal stress protein [Rhodobacter sp.]HPD91212.1 universal stress protein [Pararhodobacter sp.]
MPDLSVIAATDLSARSAHVAARARALAEVLGARLVCVHVTDGKAPAALPGDTRLLTGETAPALAALATEENAALIVLGLHRERRVLDVLRLTTMERIVLAAPCPVLIAHQPPERKYAQVLAPTDFSAGSAAALAMAARIAPGAQFHAIHALQMRLGARAAPGNREFEAAMDRAEAHCSAFLSRPGLPPLAEPPEIVPGGVHPVLAFRSAELGADLVAIGAHSGRSPDQLGNYARDLMRAPPTDLLVSKPGP